MGLTALLLAALVGFGLVTIATSEGASLATDSAFYLGVARELAAGHGLTVSWGTPAPTPMGTRWAPLLPAVLAAIAQFGPDPVTSVRWVNAFCLAATAFLCGVAIRRTTGSVVFAGVVTLLLATSQTMIGVHTMAWSEPPFIFFATLGLVLLAAHLQTRKMILLAAAITSVAAAFLTRYAGASLAITAFACLLIQPGRWRSRIAAASCAAVMAFLPMTPGGPTWISWIRTHFGSVVEDSFKGSALQCLRLGEGLDVLTNWFWPWGLDAYRPRHVALQGTVACCLIALLLLIGGGSWFTIYRRSRDRRAVERRPENTVRIPAPNPQTPGSAELGAVLGVFIAAYIAFILTAVALFGRTVSFTPRIMLPMMPAGIMALALGGDALRKYLGPSRHFAWVAGAACIAVLAVRLAGALDYSRYLPTTHGIGAQGYHHRSWRTSPTMNALRSLPNTATIYSNAPDAIYLVTGRNSQWLSFLNLQKPNPTERPRADKLLPAAVSESYIIYFNGLAWRPSSLSREELVARWPLQALTTTADGAVYSITKAVTWNELPE